MVQDIDSIGADLNMTLGLIAAKLHLSAACYASCPRALRCRAKSCFTGVVRQFTVSQFRVLTCFAESDVYGCRCIGIQGANKG